MSKFDNILYKIAGIDKESIAECPATDRILAKHLAIALSCTFVIVFLISFYSFSYIGKGGLEYDVSTNQFITKNKPEYLIYIISAIVSFITALVIALFDRSLFMSDWFVKNPFGIKQSVLTYTLNKINTLFRVIVRIVISLTVAYALSVFLELKVFESEIVRKMSENHLVENKDTYDTLSEYHNKLYESLNKKIKGAGVLEDDYNSLISSGNTTKLPEKRIKSLNQEIKDLTLSYNDEITDIDESYKSRIESKENEIIKLNTKIDELLNKKLNALNSKSAEKNGENPEDLNNISGDAGEGVRFDYWTDSARNTEELIQSLEGRKTEHSLNLDTIQNEKKKIIETITLNNNSIINSLENEKQELISIAKSNGEISKKTTDDILVSLKNDLDVRKLEIANERESLDATYNKEKNRMFSNPSYRPLIDGPLTRLTALLDIKNPSPEGDTSFMWFFDGSTKESKGINMFSLLVKSFIVFLEVVPVIAKMFFSPPTSYSYKIQNKVRIMNNREKQEMDLLNKANELTTQNSLHEVEEKIRLSKLDYLSKRAMDANIEDSINKTFNKS